MTDSTDRDDEIEIEIERDRPTPSDDSSDSDADTDSGGHTPAETSTDLSADSPSSRSHTGRHLPESPERRLEDELGRVDVSTTHDGFVEGHVVGFDSPDETTVRLEVALPHGGIVEFTLEKPIPWSEEFLLARIVDDVGYDATSISHLVDETVYVTRADLEDDPEVDWWTQPVLAAQSSLGDWFTVDATGPQWRLVDPRERQTGTERSQLLDNTLGLATFLIVLAPLVAALGVAYALTGGIVLSGPVIGAILAGFVLALLGVSGFVIDE
ncbi:hypothetical protein G6M89_04720 [Natronolimnobius sp. AArcel1]|uniref:hypothetical protein n=1 Tax=Natronolimnobius sp. AArcel1 TaxID=1679093 RepID=UPI0013EB53F8|nr:hypothetical protein [Natronolimnobius sp. AArcel1]NGM68318.1 hypothetical protein [Natronolimnobius sp. AArcel1]